MDDLTPRVHTHPFNNGLRNSRLTEYRLKAAKLRHDDLIAKARDRLEFECRMVVSHDRAATLALTHGKRVAAVTNPFHHRLGPWISFDAARDLLIPHGYRWKA